MRVRALLATLATTAVVLTGSAGAASAAPYVSQDDAALQQETHDGRYCGPGQTVKVYDYRSGGSKITCLSQVRVPHEVTAGRAPAWKFWKWRF